MDGDGLHLSWAALTFLSGLFQLGQLAYEDKNRLSGGLSGKDGTGGGSDWRYSHDANQSAW
jgi:hypothetical protein